MKIHEAAKMVLQEAGRPMTIGEIHGAIVRRDLFTFRAKDPVAMVAS
ncbi:MAG: HTH domain-containing protein [Gammaproteobacteria bacterium]|jgi:hypothetical protein